MLEKRAFLTSLAVTSARDKSVSSAPISLQDLFVRRLLTLPFSSDGRLMLAFYAAFRRSILITASPAKVFWKIFSILECVQWAVDIFIPVLKTLLLRKQPP